MDSHDPFGLHDALLPFLTLGYFYMLLVLTGVFGMLICLPEGP